MTSTTVLDMRGKLCPIPVMKAAKAILAVASGDRLEVLATDPGAVEDFKAFCETKGHKLIDHRKEGDVFQILIEKG